MLEHCICKLVGDPGMFCSQSSPVTVMQGIMLQELALPAKSCLGAEILCLQAIYVKRQEGFAIVRYQWRKLHTAARCI